MKKSYLLACLLLNIFVGSAKTVPSISNLKFGFINEKVSRTFYNSFDTVFNTNIEKNNTNSTPPCNTASISYAGSPFCTSITTGQAVTLTGTGTYTGGTYSALTGLALNTATGAIIPSQSTPGNYTVSYTVSGGTGCPIVVATCNVVIVSQTTVAIFYAGTPFCSSLSSGQAVTRSGTGGFGEGTYSGTPGLSIDPFSGVIFPSTSTTGIHTVTYTIPAIGGCAPVVATTTIVVNPKPAIPNQTVTICSGGTFTVTPINASPTTATIVPNGTTYTWTAPTVTGGITGGSAGTSQSAIFGTLTNATNVVQQVTYTVTPAVGGCVGLPFTVNVTVNPKPVIPSQTLTICSGTTFNVTPVNAAPSAIVPTGTRYTWTVVDNNNVAGDSNQTVAQSNISQTLNNLTITPQTVVYTVTATSGASGSCVGASFTITVTVNPIPLVVANVAATTICSSSTTNIALSSTVPGTTFSWDTQQTNVTGSAGQGSGNTIFETLTNLTNLPQTIVYTITPFNGCSGAPTSVTITVNPRAVIEGVTSACINGTSQLISSGSTSNFPWDSSNTAVATVDGATGLVRAVSAGTCTIFYNPSNASTCQAQTLFTVYPTPIIPNQTRTICSGSEFLVSPVNALPTTVVPDGTRYTWTISANQNITGQSNQSVAQDFIFGFLSNLTNVNQTIVYTVTPRIGGCAGAPFTVNVTVSPSPIVLNQSVIVCSDVALGINLNSSSSVAAATYSIVSINSNGVVPSAGNPSLGSGLLANVIANDAWTNTTTSPINVIYTVVPVSALGCQGNSFTVTVTVNPNPIITSQPLESQTVCLNSTPLILSLRLSNGTGIPTYQWYSNTANTSLGGTVISGANTSNFIPPTFQVGTYYYYCIASYNSGACGYVVSNLAQVIINPIPVASATATATTICSSSTTNIALTSSFPGTNFSWYTDQVNVTGSSQGSGNTIAQTLTATGNTPGSVFYTITPYVNGCPGSPIIVTITVNPGAVIEGVTSACINGTSQLFGSGTPATSNPWTSTNPAVATVSSTGLVTAVSSGVTEITYRTSNSSACSNTIVFWVYPTPLIPNQTQTICSGSDFLVSPDNALPTTVVPDGTRYTWTVADNINVTGESNQSVASDFIFGFLSNFTNVTQIVVYTVTPRIGGCAGAPFTVTITVNPSAFIPAQTVSVCSGTTFTVTPSNANQGIVPFGTTYTWTVASNSNVTGQSNQATGQTNISQTLTNLTNLPQTVVYTVAPISGTMMSCVGNSFTVVVTVNPVPAIQNQTATICSGNAFTVIPVNAAQIAIVPTGTKYTWTVAANPNVTGQSNQSVGQSSISQTLINLTNLLQTVVYTVTPTSGANGSCVGANFIVTVMVNPTTCSGFHLNAFLDSNNNGTQDAGEINFPFGQFIYQVNNVTHTIATLSGMHDVYESTNNNIYTLRYAILTQLSSYFTVSPSTYTNVQIAFNGGMTTYNFPVRMNTLNNLGVKLIPYGRPVPGFSFLNLLMYTNYGSATASGTITFTKNPLLSMGTISEPTATINSSGFTYNFTNLNRHQSKFLFFRMNTPTIPTVNLGQWLCNTATITPSTGVDIYPRNNTSTLCSMVTGSYDPNDIVESHGREIVHADFTSEDYLNYTIRFENTGNGNAVNIRVANTLDVKLDETTMEMVSSSHDYTMDRVGTGVTWNFSNIQLPPSVANTTTGKGYIMYRIKPKAGYTVGDIVPNTASIYFDFNPAIITNTFENQFVSTLEIVHLENNEFSIYPNPAKDQITIDLGTNLNAMGWSYKIVNTLGQEVLNGALNSQQNTIQLNNIKGQGVYFVKVFDSSNALMETKKIIIQ